MSNVLHSGNFIWRGAAAGRVAAALALTLALGAAAVAQRALRQQTRPTPGAEEDVVRVETRLVGIPFTVRSREGGYVGDLRREELRVYEDGVEQRVTHFESAGEPINVVLLLDFSASVRRDLPGVREVAAAFLERLRPGDRVRAVAFGDEMLVLAGGAGGDRQLLRESILKAPMMGGTALYDAVYFTLRRVVEPAGGRKAVILFTDGWDTASHKGLYELSLRTAEEMDAPFHVAWMGGGIPGAGSGPGRDADLYLRELTQKSGGRLHLARVPPDMSKLLDRVAEELRAQYSVGFYASGEPRPRKRRKLRVVVTRPGARVRAKESYVVPESGGVRP